jgi:hypothetical protein
MYIAPAAGQKRSVFSFARVYRAPLDKQKTMDFSPLRAHKKTFEAFTNGFLLIIWRVGGLKTSPLPCLRPGWFYPNLLNPDSFTVRSIRWWKNIAAAGLKKHFPDGNFPLTWDEWPAAGDNNFTFPNHQMLFFSTIFKGFWTIFNSNPKISLLRRLFILQKYN